MDRTFTVNGEHRKEKWPLHREPNVRDSNPLPATQLIKGLGQVPQPLRRFSGPVVGLYKTAFIMNKKGGRLITIKDRSLTVASGKSIGR